MRKLLMALGAAALLAAPAVANENAGDAETPPLGGEQVVWIQRYAFNARGVRGQQVAAQRCNGQPAAVRTRHTAGDVAAALFSMGWYTPEHVIIDCGTSQESP